ncbi:hypothetical protein E2C01_022714 [Portunus trituberculatus]|uniref:Uncharacterized protein n=1 Tax=Portunus trituberculatus TaxID=210409 RepID=A0A5B7E632_PORTR|nr:hypothetical protein [Portunus trituberculatus]
MVLKGLKISKSVPKLNYESGVEVKSSYGSYWR